MSRSLGLVAVAETTFRDESMTRRWNLGDTSLVTGVDLTHG